MYLFVFILENARNLRYLTYLVAELQYVILLRSIKLNHINPMKYIKRISIACLLSSSFLTFAQTDTAKVAKDTVKENFSISGYLDSYYFTNLNNPASRNNMGQKDINVGRGFDRYADQFSLGMVQTVFKYTTSNSEAVADLAFGPNAQYGNYGNNPFGFKIGSDVISGLMIKQAYFKYNWTEKFSTTVGQFATHIGYEYIDAPLNFHYSINHTFNSGIPFYHTGLKANYKFNDKWSLMAGVVNGFDHLDDNNRAKGIISQLSFTPKEGVSIYFNYITSNEADADALGKTPKANFSVYDLNGAWQATEKFMLGFWGMVGHQNGPVGAPGVFIPVDGIQDKKQFWGGANIYAAWKFNDVFTLGLRSEYFDNKQGVRGLRNIDAVAANKQIGADVYTFTLTGNVTLANGHILLKPEARFDQWSKVKGVGNENSQQFMDKDGKYSKSNQTTIGLAMIYKW